MPLTSQGVNEYFQQNRTFCLFLYGAQGTGKTILTASGQQNPLLADLAFVDADPGLASIVGESSASIKRIDFKEVKDLKDLPRYLKSTLPTVKTVVFDTVAALGSMRLNELRGDSDVVDWRHYGTITGNIERIVHNLREADYSVILTAGVKDETVMVENVARLVKRRPDLPPELNRRLGHFVDHIWHTYVSADQSYNLLVRPSFPVTGGEVVAKTRNEAFNEKLNKLQRPQMPGVIQIGKVGDAISKYPNLNTFYNLYLESIKMGDKLSV